MNQRKAFTLVELVLYVGIVSIVTTSIVMLTLNVIYGRIKSNAQKEVNQNLRYISDRIIYEIKNSNDISEITPSSITMTNPDTAKSPVKIMFEDGVIKLGIGQDGDCNINAPCTISSQEVEVVDLSFEDMTSATQTTKTVKFLVDIRNRSQINKQEFNYEASLTSSVTTEVNSP